MWRKLFLVFLLLMVCVSSVSAQEKSYSAERFDIEIDIQEDGSLLITETVTFLFVGEPFTFVFRELEGERTDGIVNIEARVDGRSYREGTDPGEVEITPDGEDVRVEWHLEPTANVAKTFTLSYQMLGVIQQTEQADLFNYQPLPDEFEYEIGSSTTTITYPNGATLLSEPSANEGATVEQFGNEIIVTQTDIDDGDEATITAQFTPGSLIAEPPLWQQERQRQDAMAPLWFVGGGLILLLGVAVLIILWRQVQIPQSKTAVPQYDPPSDLPPALAGALNGHAAEPSWTNAIATLFDLADRGVIAIEESPEKKWYQRREFEIVLLKRPSGLRPHELGLLEMLFQDKDQPTDTLKLSKLSSKLSGKGWDKFKEPLKEEMEMGGYLSKSRNQLRMRYLFVGIGMIVTAVATLILTVIFQEMFGLWPFVITVPLFLIAIGFFSISSSIKPLSDKGLAQAAEWQNFYEYLKDVTKNKAASDKFDAFYAYLPYAATYGLLANWVKWYEKRGGSELPHYFKVISASPQEGFAAFAYMANNTGGVAASGGAGGAGGAAGGGGSGAG